MDSEVKKSLGYLLLSIVAGVGLMFSNLIPEITLPGWLLVGLIPIIGATLKFFEKIIKIYTGASTEEESSLEATTYTTSNPEIIKIIKEIEDAKTTE